MVSGAQGMGGGPQLPPTIRETETQAFAEITKKYVIGMIADSMQEVIPFTQREYDEVFKYRSEASRPNIYHSLMQVRSSEPEAYEKKDESWQETYNNLVSNLPDNVKGWLEWELSQPNGQRDPDFIGVNNLLMAAAKLISWLANVAAPQTHPNTESARNMMKNIQLPYVALGNVLAQSETVLNKAESWIESMGSNTTSHDHLSNLLSEMRGSLNFLQGLRPLIKEGPASKTQENFMQAAFELNRLSTMIKQANLGDDLKILSTQLGALAKISEAWSVHSDPSPLSIGTTIATLGLTFEGQNYESMIQHFLNGISELIGSGTQTELTEMQTLYNDLAALS